MSKIMITDFELERGFMEIPTQKIKHKKKMSLTIEDMDGSEKVILMICECRLKQLEKLVGEFGKFIKEGKVESYEDKEEEDIRYIG